MEGYTQHTKHDAQILVVYTQGYDGWYFNAISPIFITYEYSIESDRWTEIKPLQNCRWNVADDQKLSWKTWSWGSEIKSGPDAPNVTLPNSSSYLVKSREGHPVTIKFTYKPIN